MSRALISGLSSVALLAGLAIASCSSDSGKRSEPAGGAPGVGGETTQPADGGEPTGSDAGAPGHGGSPVTPAGECEPPTGEGTTHGLFVEEDETWTADGNPHLLPDGLSLDATLTLEPCTVVRVGAGRDILVSGKLLAQGTFDEGASNPEEALVRPVVIEPLDDEAWGAIKSTAAGGEIELHATIVRGGGAVPAGTQPQQTGMIVIEGERALPLEPRLTANLAILIGSESQAITLFNNAAFVAGGAAIFSENAGYPILVGARAMGTLPDVIADDVAGPRAILVGVSERLGDGVPADVTLRNLGLPYRIGTDLEAAVLEVGTGNGNAASLTLEPGVELRFPAVGGISVEGPDGTLIASGEAELPIVFTSDAVTPQAGDWLGLNFTGEVASGTRLDHVEVAYAGGMETGTRSFSCGTPLAPDPNKGQTMGAVYLSLEAAPTESFLTNSLLRDSGSNGVDRGYTGEEVDFMASNTFENIAFCLQTTPKPTVGACSSDPACPVE